MSRRVLLVLAVAAGALGVRAAAVLVLGGDGEEPASEPAVRAAHLERCDSIVSSELRDCYTREFLAMVEQGLPPNIVRVVIPEGLSRKEIAPRTRRVMFMSLAGHPAWPGFLRTITASSASFRVEVVPAPVSNAAEIERSFEEFAREPDGGLIVSPSPIASMHSNLIIGLAARHRIPAVYPFRFYASDGGLMSFGVDPADLFRRAASYVDRILRGEKAADLPVQAPNKFELVINAKTAKALGLEVSPTLLATADEVIE